jgi:hypothetical protein
LERRGLILDALDTYETIVKRDPNAALERMKMQSLRGLLDSRKHEAPKQNQRFALAIAVCVTLLVISVAGAVVISQRNKPSQVATTQLDKPSYSVDSFSQADQKIATQPSSKSDESNGADDQGQQDSTVDENTAAAVPSRKTSQSPLNGALPDPTKGSETSNPDFKPVNPLDNARIEPMQTNPTVQSATTNANVGAPNNSQNADPDPTQVANQNPETKSPTHPSVVDIKLSEDPPKGGDAGMDANGMEALVRTARGQYQVGNYQAAASTYERALSFGADPALTNQRLAQCYEKLGRTSDAKAAYGHAITAIQSQINDGRGNKDRLLAALNSSQQALKNLQGG